MTPDDIGAHAAAILSSGYAVEIDRHEWWPLTAIVGGPAWHKREERAALGARVATALEEPPPHLLPMPYVDDPPGVQDAEGAVCDLHR